MTTQRSKFTVFLAWAPAVAWAAVIFFVSAQTSAPQVSDKTNVQFAIQKLGHFAVYAILAGLIYLPLRRVHGRSLRDTAIAAIVLSGLYAVSDEWHQAFVPNRTPMITDVLIDLAGAVIATLGFHLYESRRSSKTNR